jgi:hypothetical protein
MFSQLSDSNFHPVIKTNTRLQKGCPYHFFSQVGYGIVEKGGPYQRSNDIFKREKGTVMIFPIGPD